MVLLTGNVDKDVERDSLRFQIEKIEPIETIRQDKVKKLFLKIVCHKQSNPLAIKEVAKLGKDDNQGSVPLFIQLEINGVQLLFSTASTFNLSLRNQLILKLGTTCLNEVSLHYEV